MGQKGEPSAVKSDFKHPGAWAKGPEKKAEAFSAKELIEETHRVGPSLPGSDKKGNRPFRRENDAERTHQSSCSE
jgi:hypothetical protein